MKIFTYIAHGMIMVATIGIVFAIVFFKTKSPREQAQVFYDLHNQFPFGSKEEAWVLDKAIELDSTFSMAYRAKSLRYTRVGLLEEGMKYLDHAVALDPIEHLGYRGYYRLFSLHDYHGAIEDLNRLDQLTPGFRDAPWGHDIYFLLGLAYLGLEDRESAFDYIDKSIVETSKERSEEWVNVEIFLYRGLIQWDLGRPQEALEDMNKAILFYDRFSEAYFHKAKIEQALGHLSEAIQSVKMAKKTFSGWVQGVASLLSASLSGRDRRY